MSERMLDLMTLLLVIVFIAAILAAGLVFQSFSCGQRWPDMESRWGLFSGCQVLSVEGWVPEDRYRVIE